MFISPGRLTKRKTKDRKRSARTHVNINGAQADNHTQHQRMHEPGCGGPANRPPPWWPPGRVCDPRPAVPSMACVGAGATRPANRQRRLAAAEGKTRTPPHGGSFAGSPAPPPPHPQPAHAQNGNTTPPHPRLARRSALPDPSTARLTNPTPPARGPPACPTRSAAHSPPHGARSHNGALPASRMCTRGARRAAQHGAPNWPCRAARTTAMVRAADAGERAETRRHQHGKGPQEQVHQPQQPRAQGEEHEEGARGIPETRLRQRPTLQAGGELPQPEAEVAHRPHARLELLHRLVPAGINRRSRGQRTEAWQRNSAGHSGCTDGWAGGREIKISQNCSRDTDGVVNYCPPRKTGADRSSHKQQLRIEITCGTPPLGPHTALQPLTNPAPAHGSHQRAQGGQTTNMQRGPTYHPAEGPQSRRENHRCVCLV